MPSTALVAGAVALPLALFACGADPLTGNGASSSAGAGAFGAGGFGAGGFGVGGFGVGGSIVGGGAGEGGTGLPDASPDGSPGMPDAGPPPATCPETFIAADKGYTTVVLQTDYDEWSHRHPDGEERGGTWQVTTPVPYGTGRRVQVRRRRELDGRTRASRRSSCPRNAGTNTNNILQAVTCGRPARRARCSSSAAP